MQAMSLKRAAEEPAAGGEARASSNPFAGLSLSGTAPAAPLGFGSFAPASATSATAVPAGSSGGGGNPFAGISLSAPSAPAGSLFTTAAAASSGPGADTNSFRCPTPLASAPRLAFGDTSAASQSSNPFMGLSLLSGAQTPSAASGGGLFTSAASSLAAPADKEGDGMKFPVTASVNGAATAQTEETLGNSGSPEAPASQRAAAEDDAEESGDTQQDSQKATGEEEEEVIYRTECKLWKLVRHAPVAASDSSSAAGTEAAAGGSSSSAGNGNPDGSEGAAAEAVAASAAASAGQENGWRWQEKGHGILHINRHARTGTGRLVMRMRGVLKLLLNTPVFPTTKYEKVGQKSVRFVGVDSEESDTKDGQASWCAYRLNLLSSDQQGKFLKVLHDSCGVTSLA